MNTVLKIILSMSFSGSLLILALFCGKRLWKDKISRQWQYYIWLIVVLRLLLPFGTKISLLGEAYRALDRAAVGEAAARDAVAGETVDGGTAVGSAAAESTVVESSSLPQQQNMSASEHSDDSGAVSAAVPDVSVGRNKKDDIQADNLGISYTFREIVLSLINYGWLIWLAAALGMMVRKVTIYQSFIRYVNAGMNPVSDVELLDRLAVIAKQAGVKRAVELCANPLVSSPLLIGFFRPCIVLPCTNIPEKDFQYIVLHELTHYKRLDMLYKWLVQAAVCLHWFNPLVHLMGRESAKACEFACDEAVLAKMGDGNAQDYGSALLNAMAEVGKYNVALGTVTLSENKQLLKERIGAIMNFRKRSVAIWFLTGVLTGCVIIGAAFIGIYSVAAASGPDYAAAGESSAVNKSRKKGFSPQGGQNRIVDALPSEVEPNHAADDFPSEAGSNHEGDNFATEAQPNHTDIVFDAEMERYYEAGSLPLFKYMFYQLDEASQSAWMNRTYADRDIAFFSVCVDQLYTDSPLVQRFAESAYADGAIGFFSVLTDCMGEDTLEMWLDKALEDKKLNFQYMLFDELHREDEMNALDELLTAQLMEEYGAYGVTFDGKRYYYEGRLVNIFLDVRRRNGEGSVYTLSMCPDGTINIKILRNAEDEITGVSYMTDAEVKELLEDKAGSGKE